MPVDKDQDGETLPYNDDQISDDEYLLRRIDPDHHLAQTSTGYRLSSSAFSESSRSVSKYGGMSAQLERMVRDPLDGLAPGWGIVKIRVGALREKDYLVGLDPQNGDNSHTSVWGGVQGKPGRKVPLKTTDYEWVQLPDKMRS